MSYFNPQVYCRNNVLKHCGDKEAQVMWGYDFATREAENALSDMEDDCENGIIGTLKREIIQAVRDDLLHRMELSATELMVAMLDNTPEGVELEEVPEDKIIDNLVAEEER